MRLLLFALCLFEFTAGKVHSQNGVSLVQAPALRGDPARDNAFFVYPRKMRLVNRRC